MGHRGGRWFMLHHTAWPTLDEQAEALACGASDGLVRSLLNGTARARPLGEFLAIHRGLRRD